MLKKFNKLTGGSDSLHVGGKVFQAMDVNEWEYFQRIAANHGEVVSESQVNVSMEQVS